MWPIAFRAGSWTRISQQCGTELTVGDPRHTPDESRQISRLQVTASVERIQQRFDTFRVGDESSDCGHLVLAVLLEESLGTICLQNLGVSLQKISEGGLGKAAARLAGQIEISNGQLLDDLEVCSDTQLKLKVADTPAWFSDILQRAQIIARRIDDENEIDSQHLVRAMLVVDGPVRRQLEQLGVTQERVAQELSEAEAPTIPLQVDFELSTEEDKSIVPAAAAHQPVRRKQAANRVLILLDAALNRCREGLRVLEDYARFIANDLNATSELKHLRHELVTAERKLSETIGPFVRHRNVEQDVGTSLTTDNEKCREDMDDVLTANARRVQESLRSLEEFGKLVNSSFAAEMKQLRYRSYELEQFITSNLIESAVSIGSCRRARLQTSRLYVLITENLCRGSWKQTVLDALSGGADVVQLREKDKSDAELISQGRWIADTCHDADALFIINDRWDLVQSTGADGVHIGQTDGNPSSIRQKLPDEYLLGISTHNEKQLKDAQAFADYLGVGPVFQSSTKTFSSFPGTDFVRSANKLATIPWFAIGGIDTNNVDIVRDSGASAIAVSSSIAAASNPEHAATELRTAISHQSRHEVFQQQQRQNG